MVIPVGAASVSYGRGECRACGPALAHGTGNLVGQAPDLGTGQAGWGARACTWQVVRAEDSPVSRFRSRAWSNLVRQDRPQGCPLPHRPHAELSRATAQQLVTYRGWARGPGSRVYQRNRLQFLRPDEPSRGTTGIHALAHPGISGERRTWHRRTRVLFAGP
jgi:hypothetical protein